MLREKSEAVVALHDKLYSSVLKAFLRTEIEYRPHITLGRATGNPSGINVETMQAEATCEVRGEWRAVMRELAIVTHHQDGTITIDKTIPLNFA